MVPKAVIYPDSMEFQLVTDEKIGLNYKLGERKKGLSLLHDLILSDLPEQFVHLYGPNLENLKIHPWGSKITQTIHYDKRF